MAFTKLTPEEKQKRQEERKRLKYENEHKIIDGIDYKLCSKCNEYKPSTGEYFYKNDKNSRDGLSNKCIECERERAIQWKKDNPERFTILQARVEAKQERKLSNRKRAEKQRLAGKQKEWQQKNPDKLKEYFNKKQHNRHNINKQEWENCKKYFNYECAYCGLLLSEHYFTRKGITKLGDFHKEHVDHEGVNNLSNCVPSCGSCNDHKWKFTLDEFYNSNNPNFTEEKYNKIIQWITEEYKQYIMPLKPKQKYTRKNIS
jgi:hypothetical protein